jgi:hypothetical protein
VEGRTKVVVGVGFVVLAVVAAIGVRAWIGASGGYPKAWQDEEVGDLGISADRTTISAQSLEYRSGSCYELRVEAEPEDGRWVVSLRSRRTADFCTLEGCIDQASPRRVARTLAPDEALPCSVGTVVLDEPVPEGADVVPA